MNTTDAFPLPSSPPFLVEMESLGPASTPSPLMGSGRPSEVGLLARAQGSHTDTCEAAPASVSSSENNSSTPPSPPVHLKGKLRKLSQSE